MTRRRITILTSGVLLGLLAFGARVYLRQIEDSAPEKRPAVSVPIPNERKTSNPRIQAGPTREKSASESPIDFLRLASTNRHGPQKQIADGFSGSESCRECHADEFESWHASFHRTMTQELNVETAPAVIVNQTVTVQNKIYTFRQIGDHFEVTFADPLVGNQIRSRRLVLMTGSHHMHVFWYETDVHGTPGQLDIVFLKDEQQWIPRDSSFLKPNVHTNVLELGTWNRTCSRCHATHPKERYNETTQDWDTHVTDFGIACEACHGEGAAHVRKHSQESLDSKSLDSKSLSLVNEVETEVADSLVTPSKLSKQASADVCGQCHSIFIPDYDVVSQEDFMRDGNPFRPGDLLSEDAFTRVVRASEGFRDSETFKRWSAMEELSSGFWSDGTPRIAGREYNGLIESGCFQKGEMTCLSCHTMHPSADQDLDEWKDDQLKPGMRGDLACLQCHQEYENRIAEHTHHAVDSQGSRCMNCHMPHTTYGLLKTIRSHQVSSPSIQASQTSDRPDACSLCHLDQSFEWVGQHLNEWYGQPFERNSQAGDSPPIATSVLHLLSGDAAQRVVQIAAMGWKPAQEASGTDWMEPFLLLGLNDPYDAVRIVAGKSMKSLPERTSLEIDPLAPARQRMEAFNQSIELIDKNAELQPRPQVLVDENGHFDFPRVRGYLEKRNHRHIYLRE